MLTQFAAADGDLSQPSSPVISVSVSPSHRGCMSLFLRVTGRLSSVFGCMLLNSGSAADKSSSNRLGSQWSVGQRWLLLRNGGIRWLWRAVDPNLQALGAFVLITVY